MHSDDLHTGKFFTKPSGSKAAPPQQSNLKEIWGGKRKRDATSAAPSIADGPEGVQTNCTPPPQTSALETKHDSPGC